MAYTQEQLSYLHTAVETGVPLEDMIGRLPGRPRSGNAIAQKLLNLSKSDPVNWKPETVMPYVSKQQRDVMSRIAAQPGKVEQSKDMVMKYVMAHPDAKAAEIKKHLGYDVQVLSYAGIRISDIKKAVGKNASSMAIERATAYLKQNPFAATGDDPTLVLARQYVGSMDRLREMAGVGRIESEPLESEEPHRYIVYTPAGSPEYVRSADAAKLMEISRQRIFQLLKEKKLQGFRSGGLLYIELSTVRKRSMKRH